LVIERGKTRTRTLLLRKAESLIGRESGCDFRIASSEVSRRHCLLRVSDGYVTVEDLNSRNGTLLNGEPVEGRKGVRPGDRLRIGPLTFVVEYRLSPQAIDRLLRGGDSAEKVSDVELLEEVESAEEGEVEPAQSTEVLAALAEGESLTMAE